MADDFIIEKGEIYADEDGKLICHICGKSFHSLDQHIVKTHGMSAAEYKKEFEINSSFGLRSESVKNKLREKVKINFDQVIKNNLLECGKKTRFEKNSKGRTGDMLRLQAKKEMTERILKYKQK